MHVPTTLLRRLTYLVFTAWTCASLSEAQPYAYVSNLSGNNVAVVNTANFTVVNSIPVSAGPTGLAVTPDGLSVYVACQGASAVSVIGTASSSVVATINVGGTPTQLAIAPNGARVYVVLQAANQIAVIDTASKAVVASIGVGSRPNSVAFSPDGSRAFVTNLWSGTVSVIDTNSRSVVNTFNAGLGPSGLAVTPDGRTLYVANQNGNTITVHDAATGSLQNIIGGFIFPNTIAITPNGSRAFVTNGNAGLVSVIDTASKQVMASPAVSILPSAIAISNDGTRAFVANEYSFSLSVIDTTSNAVVGTVPRVGIYPVGVATVPQPSGFAPQTCSFSITPGSAVYAQSGGSGTVNVTAPSGCAWSVTSNAGWIAITSGASGSGTGAVSYAVNANSSPGAISGTLTIAGKTFVISETGLACSYSLSSTGASIGASGSLASFAITAPTGCAWNVTSDVAWIAFSSSVSGSGSGTVIFTALSNPNSTPRVGHVTIDGQPFTLSQSGTGFTPIRVNCGGQALTDSNGTVWSADNGRNMAATTASIANTNMPALYQKEAWSSGTLQYQYSVPNGSFTVKLHFAEIYLTQRGQRVFNIVVNGVILDPNVDILAQAQANTAFDVVLPVSVTTGQITVQLVPIAGPVKLSALEIY